MSRLNVTCKKCRRTFDADVGKVSFPPDQERPSFEKPFTCPRCGTLTVNDILLTELGQTQLTELDLEQSGVDVPTMMVFPPFPEKVLAKRNDRQAHPLEISEILHELEYNRGYFAEAAVKEAIRRREEITPHLLQILEKTVTNAEAMEKDEDYVGHLYAMYLLAQFRETAAYPLIIRYGRLPGELPHDLGGDLITEDFPRILASVHGGDVSPIKALIEDPTVEEFVRASGLNTLTMLVRCKGLSRDAVVAYFRTLYRGGLERKHSQVWDSLVNCTLDLHPEELMEEIHDAYKDDLVDSFSVSLADVEEAARRSIDEVLAEPSSRPDGLIDDVVAEMAGWSCFRESQAPKTEPVKTNPKATPKDKETPKIPSPAGMKPTRTGPCPCGSGHKYKKCCGKGK